MLCTSRSAEDTLQRLPGGQAVVDGMDEVKIAASFMAESARGSTKQEAKKAKWRVAKVTRTSDMLDDVEFNLSGKAFEHAERAKASVETDCAAAEDDRPERRRAVEQTEREGGGLGGELGEAAEAAEAVAGAGATCS
eukprot:SAG22_NODE_5884_length_936_cov_1.270012_1_plen_137_part_00